MITINEYVFGNFLGIGGIREFCEDQIALREFSYTEKTMKGIILEDIDRRFGSQHSDDAEILKIQLNQEISYLHEQYCSDYTSECQRLNPK